jgi:hypothetical protein
LEVGGRDCRAFQAHPIDELRDSIDFLLYDRIKFAEPPPNLI